jgi:hypothetical protein
MRRFEQRANLGNVEAGRAAGVDAEDAARDLPAETELLQV